MSEAYAPPGLTAHDLWIEKSNLNGVVLAGVAYGTKSIPDDENRSYLCALLGVFFVITLQTLLLFLRPTKGKISWPMIAYFFVMFSLSTIGFAGDVKFNQMTYIDNRNIPGGPNAFTAQYYHHWVNIMAFTSYVKFCLLSSNFDQRSLRYVVLSWVADGLVVRVYF